MSEFRCKNSANSFCYVCGQFCPVAKRKPISDNFKILYLAYFGQPVQNQAEEWAPHITCKSCELYLCSWWKGTRDCLPFGVPMIWKEPNNHINDCYFCSINISGFIAKTKRKIVYPECSSAKRPLPYCDNFPIPISCFTQ